jgi:hypothetical protein
VRLFCFARKAVGAACTRHSLRPPLSEGENDTRLGRKSRRENAKTCSFVVAKSVARVSDHGRCDSTTGSEATPAAPAYRCAHAGYTRCCQPRRANEQACLLARIASQVRQDGQRGSDRRAHDYAMGRRGRRKAEMSGRALEIVFCCIGGFGAGAMCCWRTSRRRSAPGSEPYKRASNPSPQKNAEAARLETPAFLQSRPCVFALNPLSVLIPESPEPKSCDCRAFSSPS